MTPREFLNEVVRPNADEFEQEFQSIRRAHNAVASVDALAARIYHWLADNRPAALTVKNDSEYRDQLAKANPDFQLVRDLAKALKHYRLHRHAPKITSASQVSIQSLGWGEGRWGEVRWGSPPQVHVSLDNGDLRAVDGLVRNAIAVLEGEMTKYGI